MKAAAIIVRGVTKSHVEQNLSLLLDPDRVSLCLMGENDKRVFIIEPNRIIGMELQLQLEQNGYTVHRPISPYDTEVVMRRDEPDLVIAESVIARQMEFNRIKKYFIRNQSPIIYITSESNNLTISEKELNIIGIFSKPFDSKDILALASEYFKRSFYCRMNE